MFIHYAKSKETRIAGISLSPQADNVTWGKKVHHTVEYLIPMEFHYLAIPTLFDIIVVAIEFHSLRIHHLLNHPSFFYDNETTH